MNISNEYTRSKRPSLSIGEMRLFKIRQNGLLSPPNFRLPRSYRLCPHERGEESGFVTIIGHRLDWAKKERKRTGKLLDFLNELTRRKVWLFGGIYLAPGGILLPRDSQTAMRYGV